MTPTDLRIVPIETPTLGDRSYVVHDGDVAFVVDPQRDIGRTPVAIDDSFENAEKVGLRLVGPDA